MKTIIEGAHFYSNIGMTKKAGLGWNKAQELSNHYNIANTMLFIDDVHKFSQFEKSKEIIPIKIDFSEIYNELSDYAKDLIIEINKNLKATIDQPLKLIKPDYITLEGEMKEYTDKVLDILFTLSKKQGKPRKKSNGEIFSSGGKIIQSNGQPTCVGYDLGLTYYKDKELGFDKGINILPNEYDGQQDLLNKIYKKVNPNFKLEQYLY